MLSGSTTPIRVLLWIPPGVYRSIVCEALASAADVAVVDAGACLQTAAADRAAALRDAVAALHPDVVVVPAPEAEVRRLVGDVGDSSAVFVSTEGRSALAYDGDVSASALVRLIRAVARRAPHD